MHPIEEHIDSLRKFCLSLTRDQTLADDIVQEALLKALKRWESFNGRNLKSWLFTIGYNSYISYLRRMDNRADSLDEMAYEPQGRDVNSEVFVSDFLNQFNRLDTRHKEVLYLVCVEGFSYAQAADILAIPKGTVMSRLSRAREAFRALYDE